MVISSEKSVEKFFGNWIKSIIFFSGSFFLPAFGCVIFIGGKYDCTEEIRIHRSR